MPKTRPTIDQVQRELADTAATLPIVALLGDLFDDPTMFGSFGRFEEAGFSLVEHSPNKIMTGRHKRARGYVFKKYDDDKPGGKQLRSYMHRVEGSRLLRTFIAEHGFTHVVTPRKWLHALPSAFPERYLVVAEEIDLVSRAATDRACAHISKEQARELATVLYYFRGLNSTAANLPYTKDDKIAFVDTERWHRDKDYLHRVGDRLPVSRVDLADEVYEVLRRQGARPYESSFK
jgi:hypothetical protein